ncbi:MAG: glycosyltransferase family 2 protein [Thermoproteota archaeon]
MVINNFEVSKQCKLPLVSIIIPTYNAGKTLDKCLKSIFNQDYPNDKIEVIIIDGGSTDNTREIASHYKVRILKNPYRTQEGPNGGKAIGVKYSRGDILCFLDSDNIIYGSAWLRSMVYPLLEDENVVVCESSRILNKRDPAINRFCSYYVLETDTRDPFILLPRTKDRILKNKKQFYYTYYAINDIPCLANGSTIRANILKSVGGYDYDTDVIYRLVAKGHKLFAQSTCGGIHHLYVMSFSELITKAIKRIQGFLLRSERIGNKLFLSRRKSDLSIALIKALFPVKKFTFALSKVRESRDIAWLYYPVISFLVAIVYLLIFILYGGKNQGGV